MERPVQMLRLHLKMVAPKVVLKGSGARGRGRRRWGGHADVPPAPILGQSSEILHLEPPNLSGLCQGSCSGVPAAAREPEVATLSR